MSLAVIDSHLHFFALDKGNINGSSTLRLLAKPIAYSAKPQFGHYSTV